MNDKKKVWPDYFTVTVDALNDVCIEREKLRAELAAVKEERDKMWEALKPFAEMASLNNMQEYAEAPDDCVMTAGSWGNKPLLTFRLGDLRRARAAIEGVKENKS